MTVGLHHPTLGVPRAYCPTMSVSMVYVIALSVTAMLMLLGHPTAMAIEVPLTVLAGVRVLVAINPDMMITMLRAMLATANSIQGGVSA